MNQMRRPYRTATLWVLCVMTLLLLVLNVLLAHYFSSTGGSWQIPIMYKTLAISVVAILGMITAAFLVNRRGRDLSELIHSGDWVLRTALKRKPALTRNESRDPAGLAVTKELDNWLSGIRHELLDGSILQTSEMARDVELAKDFQLAYLNRPYPKVPSVHVEGRLRLSFYHRYEPALALGGDFFDILALGPDTAGMFIADVMGHGTRSALLTAVLRTQLRDIAQRGRNAPLFMGELNEQFCRTLRSLPEPLFASAFYFLADTTARVATFSSAGHPTPFHVKRGAERVGQVSRLTVSEPRGAALGLIRKEQYSAGHVRLIPGDVFIFFTDGLYEAHNPKGDEMGLTMLQEILRGLMYKNLKGLVDGLIDAVNEFQEGEPLMDDVCIVAVEVTDKAEGAEPNTASASDQGRGI